MPYVYQIVIILKILEKELFKLSGIIFFIATVFTLSLLLLFKNYQDYFKNYYISYLKSIYPHTFVYDKPIKKSDDIKIQHKKEIHKIALENLEIYFHKKNHIEKSYIKSVGIRSFDKNFIPDIIKNSYQQNTIHISRHLYEKIISDNRYSEYISFKNKDVKFKIKPFDSYLEDDYILLDNNIARSMFKTYFNITNIYSPYKEEYIKNKYYKDGIKITTWRDRLPFFNRVFYNIFLNMFIIYTIIFIALISIFTMFFLSSLLEDIKKAISQIMYFGNSFLYATCITFIIAIMLCFSIFICSYLLYIGINKILINYFLSGFENITTNTYLNEGAYSILLMFLFSMYFTYLQKRDRNII